MPDRPKKVDLSEDDQRMLDFVDFVKGRGVSADELRAAYYHVLAPDDYPLQPGTVMDVAGEMKRLVEVGFPVSRFVTLVSTKEKYEDAVQAYVQYVETLPVSEKERTMLKTILRRKRTGRLTLIVGEKDIMAADIVINHDITEAKVALQLMDMLKTFMAHASDPKRMEFRFEE